MINTYYSTPETKYNGYTHNRTSELKAHRKTIDIASTNMVNAAANGDFKTADGWSKIIDKCQQQIFSIIKQENDYSSQAPENYKKYVSSTTDGIESIADVCGIFSKKGILKQAIPSLKQIN